MERIQPAGAIERVLVQGDLSQLSERDRVAYYLQVCQSLGLNHLTRPFEYIRLNGKLTLYARRDCAEQLRKLHGISIELISRTADFELGICTMEVKAIDRQGRTDYNIGAVSITNLKGEQLANALMRCWTKATRRVTLSICGLGCLDESEVEDASCSKQVELPVIPSEAWRCWKSPEEAILWACKLLPNYSRLEIRDWFDELEPVNGKKAQAWFQMIIEMTAN